MKPISPFDSAPVSAMNFPVSEYVSAFRDAGKMQMAGQQSMMEGINKGIYSVTDYLEESRKSQAQANAFKPFFNKATLQNLMGISGDESAAVIEQFKNASTDEKIALGKVLTGTLVEAENQKKQLLANQDIALANLAVKLKRPIYPSGGGGVSEEVSGAQSVEPALPVQGYSSLNEPSLVPPIPNRDTDGSVNPVLRAVNKPIIAGNEEEKQRQIEFQNSLKLVNQNLNEANKKPMETLKYAMESKDKYLEHDANRQIALNTIAALEQKGDEYILAGNNKMGDSFHNKAEGIRKNQPDLLKPFGELKEVSSIIENYRSPKIEGYKNKLTDLKTVVDTARKELPNPNGKSNAISIIQKAIAPRLASLASDNALGETEAKRLMDEITSVFGKEFLSKSVEKLKKGEGISGLFGNNVEQYLDNIDKISTGLMLRYNKNITDTVINPLGSYAAGKGINLIDLSEFGIKKPEETKANQGGVGTQVNTPIKLRATTSGITPGGNTGVAPENKPKAPVYYEPSYNF